MFDAAARMAIILVLAGVAFAFSTQGAAAGGGTAGVTVVVNGERSVAQRAFARQGHPRFAGHRLHRAEPRAFHRLHRHGRHATGRAGIHGMHRGVSRLHHRTPHAADVHHHSRRVFHGPRLDHFAGHRFKAPPVHSFQRFATPRFKSHGVVVVRPSRFHGFVRHHRSLRHVPGGKLIILSPSSGSFKHIVIVPSHSRWRD